MRFASIKVLITLVVLTCTQPMVAYANPYKYNTGTLTYVGNNQVIVGGRAYVLTPSVKVVAKVKERGAYYERRGNLSDLRMGEKVQVRAAGDRVVEIVVVR